MPHALFVFAHQDDELAAATRMMHLARSAWTISAAYLTNGETPHATSRTRDHESRRVLALLGVDAQRMHFLGSENGIPDGALHEHLDRALQLLEERVSEPVDEMYCLAWEGGHHDHDASHLVAAAFAARRGVIDRCFEMPLYQGHRLPGPLFRTLAPLRVGGSWNGRRIRFSEGLEIAMLCRFYRSQWKTWAALLPGALVRLVLGRREWSRGVDVARLRDKPHDGRLFYERRFDVEWEEFAPRARTFVAAHFPAGGGPSPRHEAGRLQ